MATTADVAALFGWKLKTAERRLRSGDFPGAVKFGKRWYLPRNALDALAQGRKP